MPLCRKTTQRLSAHLITRIHRQQAGARNNFDLFHPFPLLPTELRLKIWTASLPGPQIHSPTNHWDSFTLIHKPAQHPPIALQISRESREVALKHYQLRDVACLLEQQRYDDRDYAFYVDYSIDKFVFPSEEEFALSLPIQKAADIPTEKWNDYSGKAWNTFLGHHELSKLVDVRIFVSAFKLTAEGLRTLLRSWLGVWPALRLLTMTIYLDHYHVILYNGEEFYVRDYQGVVGWVIKHKMTEIEKVVRDEIERHRHEKLAEGLDWEISKSEVEFVRGKPGKFRGCLTYEI